MNNQASTLQNLVETEGMNQETPEEFLDSVPRTNKCRATALIFPQEYRSCFPEITSWITAIMGKDKACLWDQAGLVNEAMLPKPIPLSDTKPQNCKNSQRNNYRFTETKRFGSNHKRPTARKNTFFKAIKP